MSQEQKVVRKLKAIMSADVKGYSLLMADDEVMTLKTLNDYREIMSDLIISHSGRVVDTVGDNMLAEFSSAVDAVDCSVKIQDRLKKENSKLAEKRRLQFRIGINVGDVIHDGERIAGDGVNIAARIESLADAGGVCISRNTYDQIKNKLQVETEYLGEHGAKNIMEPLRIYRILMDSDSPEPFMEEKLELPDLEAFFQDEHLILSAGANVAAISFLTHHITRIQKAVKNKAKLREAFKLLRTVPGIGEILALTIMLEVGDIRRFANVGDFASYARCVPTDRISNENPGGHPRISLRPFPYIFLSSHHESLVRFFFWT